MPPAADHLIGCRACGTFGWRRRRRARRAAALADAALIVFFTQELRDIAHEQRLKRDERRAS